MSEYQETSYAHDELLSKLKIVSEYLYAINPQYYIDQRHQYIYDTTQMEENDEEKVSVNINMKIYIFYPLLLILAGIYIGLYNIHPYLGFSRLKPFPAPGFLAFLVPAILIIAGIVLHFLTSFLVTQAMHNERKANKIIAIGIYILLGFYPLKFPASLFIIGVSNLFTSMTGYQNIIFTASLIYSIVYTNKRANRYVRECNEQIDQGRKDKIKDEIESKISTFNINKGSSDDEIEGLKSQLLAYTDGWYPARYLNCSDCESFIMLLENSAVDNMQDLISMHKVEMYKKEKHEIRVKYH